ncbi:hypothetical protein [endosymbiont GvMRE of Glomus versiforme]|uniref:hypothetical protein n=1 Tax=endosymbiont GvMRE of Glomus versiforme TaxID=2039283 RepID=UPI001C0E97B2|nr:hypothetical protein [endosymbiont GvMRE of Glomus versiforme]
MPKIEVTGSRKIICSSCGREIEKPVKYTNKCENCYNREAKIFFWVISGIAIFLLLITLIKYLVGNDK